MKKTIILSFILSIILYSFNFAAVKSKTPEYSKEQREQWVTRDEWNKWRKKMQKWFDAGADKELLEKIASRSEAHGYIRKEKEIN